MGKLTYKLSSFEGPLDLLLFLIRKNKLNICDIRIADLVGQYMEQVDAMQEQNMEVTSEFLEMAARLVYMKTISLLPKPEEAEQLRQDLTGQLLQYDECRRAAGILGEHFSFDTITRPPEEIQFDTAYHGKITPAALADAYGSAVGRGRRFLPPKPEEFSGIVSYRVVSITSRIVGILRRLWKTGVSRYKDLYNGCRGRSELVATFLAVLELIKGQRIRLEGEGDGTVRLLKKAHFPGRRKA